MNPVATFKIGKNRGAPRIWLDGARLTSAGFVGGSTYFASTAPGSMVLALAQTEGAKARKVTGKPGGKPVIDICGADVVLAFPQADRVRAEFSPGRISLSIHLANAPPAVEPAPRGLWE